MKYVTSLSVDLAKKVFQLHGTNKLGKTLFNKRVNRATLLKYVVNLKPCAIYMEGCGSANYWGRKFEEIGHKVKLINPAYVKPYVKRNKNDYNDAAAITSASRDPEMRFGSVKSEHQQDIQTIHRVREMLIRRRTGVSNQTRGILAEYGIIIPVGIHNVRKKMPSILEDSKVSKLLAICLQELYEELVGLDKKIATYNKLIKDLCMSNESCQLLTTIPGIAEINATILSSVLGNGVLFKNGRHFAAFLGLTPRQHSSGNKERLLGISKGGDKYIRKLLIQGARSVVNTCSKKNDKQSKWIRNLMSRSCGNKAVVALANKMARMAWAVTYNKVGYDANFKLAHKKPGSLATAL